jgi:hypothetical protein
LEPENDVPFHNRHSLRLTLRPVYYAHFGAFNASYLLSANH